jgi:hypothetical protein
VVISNGYLKLKPPLAIHLFISYKMSVLPNTFIEHFDTSAKDIWSVASVSVFDEIHKDLYMKLSKQAEEIAALTKLCQTFKAQADEASSLKGVISSEIIALKGDISSEIITLKGDIKCEIITVKGDINCEINSLKSEIASLKQAAALAVTEQEEMKCLIAEDKEWDAGWEEVGCIVNAGLAPLEERLKSLENKIKLQSSYTSFKCLEEKIVKMKEEMNPVTSVKMDMGLLGLEGRAEMAGIKAEMVKMKRDITKQLLDVKSEMSSLLSGDFYIHAGGSPHGKISTNSGGTAVAVEILSQDHMINIFTGYDVAEDGTVKVNCSGKDASYLLKQRWSFERATDKLIRRPDGSLMSIPLNT